MLQPIPYLAFDGNCDEAMRFYERTLGGKLDKFVRNAYTPWAYDVPEEQRQRVIHACLTLDGNAQLFAGDYCTEQAYEGIKSVSLTLNYDSVEKAQQVFNALAEGGKVTMAMQPAFWAKSFGMLVDRFGTPWIVNGELQPY